jgi:16S rRNA (guanine527-N7)-methyltransferase
VFDEVLKYFPQLSNFQKEQFKILNLLYEDWNRKINVISRKDMDNFYIHHVLHSLAIAKIISFVTGTTILDAGTGGGFPGIPLAILFPSSGFSLLDSIEKKITVVRKVSEELKLSNVNPVRSRLEDHKEKYDFVVSRAVTSFPDFARLTSKNVIPEGKNLISNGIIYLKGGDLTSELKGFEKTVKIFDIKEFFSETFFETKKIVYLPADFLKK